MKNRIYILYLIVFAFSLLNIGFDIEEYNDLENMNVPIIKKDDLPSEFSDNAYRIIVDFIQKTRCLDYEWAIFFDYSTGEILKCAKGITNKVKIDFDDGEFEGCHIASIHNHPAIDSFSPPSGKNFNILCRAFEDYELVVGRRELWILKAKGFHKNLIEDVRFSSWVFYMITLSQCANVESIMERNRCEDSLYGDMLLKYINNKNINDIQLTKKEYVDMTNNSESCVAEFEDFKHISDPEDYELVSDFLDNPDSEINKQRITDFFAKMNVEIDADALAEAMPRYKKLYNF